MEYQEFYLEGVELLPIEQTTANFYCSRGENYFLTRENHFYIRCSNLTISDSSSFIYQDCFTKEYIWVQILDKIKIMISSTKSSLYSVIPACLRFKHYLDKYNGDYIKATLSYLYRCRDIRRIESKYDVCLQKYFNYIQYIIYCGPNSSFDTLYLCYNAGSNIFVLAQDSINSFKYTTYSDINTLMASIPSEIKSMMNSEVKTMISSPTPSRLKINSETVVTRIDRLPMDSKIPPPANLVIYTNNKLANSLQKMYPNALIIIKFFDRDIDYVIHQFHHNYYNTKYLTWCRDINNYSINDGEYVESSKFYTIERNNIWDLDARLRNMGLIHN